jgi:GcrA cell cycle regulator
MWTFDTILLLRTLWSQGFSTAEIGRRIGVSKNAIVGKAHRLDLDARPSPIRRDHAPARMAPPRPQPPRLAELAPLTSCAPEPPKQPVKPAAAPTVARPNPPVRRAPAVVGNTSCCWPIGEPGTKTFRFCDDRALAGKPYCDEHTKLAYRPKSKREDQDQAAQQLR